MIVDEEAVAVWVKGTEETIVRSTFVDWSGLARERENMGCFQGCDLPTTGSDDCTHNDGYNDDGCSDARDNASFTGAPQSLSSPARQAHGQFQWCL